MPDTFRSILWSYDFDEIDPIKNRKTIVLQTINYGTLAQWRWLVATYGRDGVREIITAIPVTALRVPARRLAALIFGVDHFNYAPRGSH